MLFGSNVLDFAIGMVLVYLLLSMICSFVNERITSALNLRANALIFGLHGMIGDYAAALLDHPLIASLGKQSGRGDKTPSYIPSQNFFFALIHTIAVKDGIPKKIADLQREAEKLGDAQVRAEVLQRIKDIEVPTVGVFSIKPSEKHKGVFPSIRPMHVERRSDVATTPLPTTAPPTAAAAAAAASVASNLDEIRNRVAALSATQLGQTSLQAFDTLVDALKQGVTNPSSIPDIKLEDLSGLREAILRIQAQPLRDALLPLIDAAQGSFDRFQINVEDWFNGAMDRLSGWYKRRTSWIILMIALVVTVALNGDTFAIGNSLWHNEGQRTASIAAAQKLLTASTPIPGQQSPPSTSANPSPTPTGVQLPDEDAKTIYDQIKTLQVPIGYTTTRPNSGSSVPWFKSDWWTINFGTNAWGWVFKGAGWVITALALTLGAHFWFDALGNLMNLRYAGAPPQGKPNVATSGPPSTPPAPGGGGGGNG